MKVKVITVATDKAKGLTELTNSMDRLNIDYTILGLGQKWSGFGMKVILTREYLKTLEGYTHFIFVDAYDTLFLKSITPTDKIIFSAEKGCWPDINAPYPDSTETWRYLNSGTYMAPIKEFLQLTDKYPIQFSDDDQRYFTNIYLKEPESITLDHKCEYFQSYAFTLPDELTITDTQIINNKTHTTPAIIHFNGKCLEPKIYAMLKYSTLEDVKKDEDTPEKHKEINETFIEKVNANPGLRAHRDFVENNVFGFGERSFQWMWELLVDAMPQDFTFLEIGVFKGQTLSLIELLNKCNGKTAKRYGVTPLSNEGGVWDSDYENDIKTIHQAFDLKEDYIILKGLSEDPAIIKKASKLKLDILYIDGGHEERHITNDIEKYSGLVKKGGYMVIDDCCNSFKMPFGYFQGIEPVTKVVDKLLPIKDNNEWEFVFSVVHNRIYKKLV